ncbi:MAG: hypothetical protein IJX23_03990 [Clostridia bacterium]|nr:hypothetical protein [Clostridia bacterium]
MNYLHFSWLAMANYKGKKFGDHSLALLPNNSWVNSFTKMPSCKSACEYCR